MHGGDSYWFSDSASVCFILSLQRYMFLGESPNVLPIFLGNFGVVLPIFLGNFAARILCIVPDSLSIMVLCDGVPELYERIAIPAQIADGLSRKCYVRFIWPQVHLGHL